MRVRVKICGVKRFEDVQAAVEAGADAIGFNFVPSSPRFLSLEEAALLARFVPPFVARVGVWVNPRREEMEPILSLLPLEAIQLHGEESPEFCASFSPRPVLKALRVREEADIERIGEFLGAVQGVVLDAFVPGQRGGTGRTFPWEWALRAKERFPEMPLILSGGLTPENVAEAVRQVRPYGVDVSSGVERERGVKDPGRIRRFLQAVRECEREGETIGVPRTPRPPSSPAI